MNIKLHEKRLVGQGPAFEDTIWGVFQFPNGYLLPDGSIVSDVHYNDDTHEHHGKDRKHFISKDGGENWEDAPVSVSEKCGTLLPNGDRLFILQEASVIMNAADAPPGKIANETIPGDGIEYSQNGKMPRPLAMRYDIFSTQHSLYLHDTLPGGLIKKGFPFLRQKKGESKFVKEYCNLEWDWFSVGGYLLRDEKGDKTKDKLLLSVPWAYGRLRIAPDGSVWLPQYTCQNMALNPRNGALIHSMISVFLRSDDNGRTFKLVSFLEHVRDSSEEPEISGGFLEPDIAFMPDGSIITLMRTVEVCSTGGREWGPSYIARSVDNGVTWSKPERFEEIGVLPKLCALKCGVTLAAYGRPGIYIRATADPKGLKWEKPIEIMTGGDRSGLANNPPTRPNFWQWAGSCCNIDLIALSDNEAMLFYTDFYYPDATGKKRKSLFAQKITVEVQK